MCAQYLRLMFVWTITTAFSGVYQSLAWLEGGGGSDPEVCLVWALLILSVAGMIGNVSLHFSYIAGLSCVLFAGLRSSEYNFKSSTAKASRLLLMPW